jgi:cation diffusion facilitator family transporter
MQNNDICLKYPKIIIVNASENQNKRRLAYLEGLISIVVNSLLFALKYWAGIVSGSIALIADAWHTLSDSLSSIIVIVGTKLSGKRASKKHPYGFGRWQQISAIFVGVLLSIVAFEFAKESIEKFSNKETANFGTIAIVVTIISIILKEALARYAIYIGKKTDNSVVKADGWHHRSDALSSVVVLAGILFRDFFWWIDSVLGMAIALLLFYAVFDIIKEAIGKLLGVEASEELINQIKAHINELFETPLCAHHFHIHDYGDHKELSFHIMLDERMDLKASHKIVDKIEEKLRLEMQIESTIHVDPLGKGEIGDCENLGD